MISQNGDAIKYYRSRDNVSIDFNLNMFVEDISYRIMPIGGESRYQKKFEVNVKGQDRNVIGALFSDFIDSYDLRVKERLISNLIREIGTILVRNGVCLFEITEMDDSLYLSSFTSRNTYRIPFYFLQLIPKTDWDFFNKKFNLIPAKKVLEINLPDELGGKRKHEMRLKQLRTSDSHVPQFWQETLQKNEVDFSFSEYRKNKDLNTLKIVKNWGWDKRGIAKDELNGFYKIYRTIQFAWSNAILREHIKKELNDIFLQLDLDIEIEVIGLPTAKEIKNVQERLIEEKINFEEAYDLISI